MTPREQRRFDRLAAAVRRILAYSTPRQLQRESTGRYGLEYTECLEMAYENMRGEAEVVRHLVRPRRARTAKSTSAVEAPSI